MHTLVSQNIKKAINLLSQGEVIAFPTETVYGLGADISNPNAIHKLFVLKRRPLGRPLSLLVPDMQTILNWANDVPESLDALHRHFWPGPLTVILHQKLKGLQKPLWNNGHLGFRISSHPVVHQLLTGLGGPLAAPSANISGQISLTRAVDVRKQFQHHIPLILQENDCKIGMESTILDLTQHTPRILRVGAISQTAIESVLNMKIHNQVASIDGSQDRKIKLFWVSQKALKQKLQDKIADRTGILALNVRNGAMSSKMIGFTMPQNVSQYQNLFYHRVQQLYKKGCHIIWVEEFPKNAEWASLTERLNRWCLPMQEDKL